MYNLYFTHTRTEKYYCVGEKQGKRNNIGQRLIVKHECQRKNYSKLVPGKKKSTTFWIDELWISDRQARWYPQHRYLQVCCIHLYTRSVASRRSSLLSCHDRTWNQFGFRWQRLASAGVRFPVIFRNPCRVFLFIKIWYYGPPVVFIRLLRLFSRILVCVLYFHLELFKNSEQHQQKSHPRDIVMKLVK